MSERATPLAALHTERGARLSAWEGCLIPSRYTDPGRELAGARAGAALFDLAAVGAAAVTGADCRRFLNGMFTNNLRRLSPGQGCRSGLADLKGRLIAVADVYCTGDDPDAFLVVPEGRDCGWLFERLGRYIIMDDVELEDLGEQSSLLSIQGPRAGRQLASAGLPVPAEQLAAAEGIAVMARDRSGLGGYDLLVRGDRLEATWEALLGAGAHPGGTEALELLRVRAGKPRFPVDVGEKRFAHELLLRDELLAFDKGCYLGQEVINRMDTMGRINRQLAGLRVEGSWDLLGAVAVHEGRELGEVTSAGVIEGVSYGLAVLHKAAIEAGAVTLVPPGGEAIRAAVTSPPFSSE